MPSDGFEYGVSELLNPYVAGVMQCYLVSTRINHVVDDDEECSRLKNMRLLLV